MVRSRLFRSAPIVLLALAMATPLFAAPRAKQTSAPKIDPKAVQLLRQMGEYVASLQSFSVHVDAARDLMIPSNQALTSNLSYDLMVRRPDRLRVNMTSAAGGAQVFYDGKTLTVYTPSKNFYSTTPAAPTIEATIQDARKRGIALPLAEFIGGASHQRLLSNMLSATFVGTSMLGNTMTNQLAFRQKSGVDWQIWIEDSSTPLPIRLMIIDRKAKDYPRYMAMLSNWNTDAAFPAGTFTFTPPQGAEKINFKELPRPRGFGQIPKK